MSPLLPRIETGVYWGYTVRIAKSLSDIFTKSPYENGYDLSIGTSDKGESVHTVDGSSLKFNHALIVFGGVQGLEAALENDSQLDADDPSLLFDQYVNVVPSQGKRGSVAYRVLPVHAMYIYNFITEVYLRTL